MNKTNSEGLVNSNKHSSKQRMGRISQLLRTLFCPQPPSSHTSHLLPGLVRSTYSAATASAPQFSVVHKKEGGTCKIRGRDRDVDKKGGKEIGMISDM